MWHEQSKIALANVYEDLENGIVKLDKLADTLSHMSDEGFNDFYIGDISKSIVETLKIEGGHATQDDFNGYELIEENKFEYQYKNLKLTGHSGPSIGGLMVLKYLNALSVESQNIEETLKNVYLDRQNNYEFFGSRGDLINNEISKISTSSSTIQVNTSDKNNFHFSITFSSGYGSGVLCKNTGMYFNNSLGEIELNPQGFLGDTKGDRLISNMSPLIIESNEGVSTIGSPGADRISSAIAQVLTNYTNGNTWKESINMPRFHVNADGGVRAEPGYENINENTTITDPFDMYFGGVCVTGRNDDIFSYGDKRRGNTSWQC